MRPASTSSAHLTSFQAHESSSDWRSVSPPPRGRRVPKAVRYSVEMEYSRPLGWISRAADGKFVLRNGPLERRLAPDYRDACQPIPSSQAGVRGSLRSDGSGQSNHLLAHPSSSFPRTRSPLRSSQVSFSPASQGIPTVYSPRDSRFRTSSPGNIGHGGPFFIEDISSVLPSSAERSFPSTVSSHFVSLSNSQQTPSPYELPILRPLHEPAFATSRQFRPIQKVQADVHRPPVPGPQTPRRPPKNMAYYRPHIRVGPNARIWRDGRHIHLPGHVPQHPSRLQFVPRRLEVPVPQVSAIQKVAMTPRQQAVYQRLQTNELALWNSGVRPLATSSPPRHHDRRVARVPPSPAKPPSETHPKSLQRVEEMSDTSSGEQPLTYTRDRLIGAVERVRSSALYRGEPFRHSAPELATTGREPTPLSVTSDLTPPLQQQRSSAPAEADSTYVSDDALHGLEPFGSSSRASVASCSSGRGSSGHGSKLSHSRGDSLQGELELANRSSGSSSGFASRSVSNLQSPRGVPTQEAGMKVSQSPLPIQPPPAPHLHDVSADENYEFDPVSPLESELLEKLQRYTRPRSCDRGLSDSELYVTNLYPKPKRPSKYGNTEARCAALKEEFLEYRRRHTSSDQLESVC